MALPTDPNLRKAAPIFSGVLMYFPDAIVAVAECSKKGNDQHHPDKPLHWDRNKSKDEHDALVRHLMEAGTFDTDGVRHSAKVAWRALAALQKELEAAGAAYKCAADELFGKAILEEGDWYTNLGEAPDLPGDTVVEMEFFDGERWVGRIEDYFWYIPAAPALLGSAIKRYRPLP